MNFLFKKIALFMVRDVAALNKYDGREFSQKLAELKKRLPKDSAPKKSIRQTMDIRAFRVGGGVCYTARDKNISSCKKVLFIHGGGLFLEAMPLHWDLCRRLAKDTGCEIIFPQYPLVPESSSEASHAMLLEVYRQVMKDTRPEDVTIIGDSAGGTLALSVSMMARDTGLPPAHEIVLISPGFKTGRMTEKERARAAFIEREDPILGQFPIEKISVLWNGSLDVNDYRADVTKGSIDGLPHITMMSGTYDMMNIPARRFAARMKKEGHPFSYIEKKGGAHDYALLKSSRKEYEVMVSKIMG